MPHTAGVRAAKTGRHSVPSLVSSTRASCGFAPGFYASFQDLPKSQLSFEAAPWRREAICSSFCSREYGCNNIYCPPPSTQPSCSVGENRLYRISPALNFSACSSNIKRTALPWAVAQPEVTSAGSNCRAAARLPRGNRASSRKRKCRRG